MLSSDDNCQELVIAFYHTFLVSAFTHTDHFTTSSTARGGINSDNRGWLGASQSTQHPPKNSNTITCWTGKNREKQKAQETAARPPWRQSHSQVCCCPAGRGHQGLQSALSCIPIRLQSLELTVTSTTWYKYKIKADKMAQKVKVIATKPGKLCSIPRKEKLSPAGCPWICISAITWACARMCTCSSTFAHTK